MLAISRFSSACKYLTCTVIGSKLDTPKNFFNYFGFVKRLREAWLVKVITRFFSSLRESK